MLGVSQRLRQGCRGRVVVDKRSAEPVGRHDKACSHVLAQQRDIGRVRAVTHCQSSARVAAVGRIAKCRIGALDLTKDPELAGSIGELKSLKNDFLSKVPFLALSPKERTPSNTPLSEIVLRAFQKRLAVNRAGGTVIAIQFSSTDPQRAADIANAVGESQDRSRQAMWETNYYGRKVG